MKKFIKDWWPLLLIAGWWLWKRNSQKKNAAQGRQEIRTREEAIQYLKDNFGGISGVVGWSHRDLDPNGGPYPEGDSVFIPGLSIGGEYVTADYGDNLMAAFRVLFGDAPVKAIYSPAFMIPGHGMAWPSFKVIFLSDESATEARQFLADLFHRPYYKPNPNGMLRDQMPNV